MRAPNSPGLALFYPPAPPEPCAPWHRPGQIPAAGVYDQASERCLQGDYTPSDYREWELGHALMLQAAQKRAPDGVYVVANNNATRGVRGRQFERWCHADFDGNSIVQNIAELRSELAAGKIALVHGGEPCDAASLALSLSAFLMGAARGAYFACTDGWSLHSGWLPEARAPEYDRALGAPLGAANVTVRASRHVYERSFASGTRALLVVDGSAAGPQRAEGCVFWSGGEVTGDRGSGSGDCPYKHEYEHAVNRVRPWRQSPFFVRARPPVSVWCE